MIRSLCISRVIRPGVPTGILYCILYIDATYGGTNLNAVKGFSLFN
jgi:hypothetical protein